MSNKTRPSMKNELARVHTSSSSQNSVFHHIKTKHQKHDSKKCLKKGVTRGRTDKENHSMIGSSICGQLKSHLRRIQRIWPLRMLEVTSPEVCSAHARKCIPALFSNYSSSTKCVIAHDRQSYRKWHRRGFHWVCATGSCAISAVVGPFDQK